MFKIWYTYKILINFEYSRIIVSIKSHEYKFKIAKVNIFLENICFKTMQAKILNLIK